ncbi:hypothetical protein GQ457_02G031770 [Hibiscus cannabinus]
MLIDCEKGELTIRVNDQQVTLNIFKSLKQPDDPEECQAISAVKKFNFEVEDFELDKILSEARKIEEAEFEDDEPQKVNWIVNRTGMNFESLDLSSIGFKTNKPFIEKPPILELKPQPEQLKYVYLGRDDTLPVIISSKLQHEHEKQLINTLARNKKAIGWTIADLKGISPTICSHKILLEEGHNNSIEALRRLNPAMIQVVMKEIIKWLDTGIIFPISDSAWENLFIVFLVAIQIVQCTSNLSKVYDVNFSDMVEDFLEIFIDDFSVFGGNFDICLSNLEKDKAFIFDDSCAKEFEDLKKQLASAPIRRPPNWSLPFEVMYDANDFDVGVVLGQ